MTELLKQLQGEPVLLCFMLLCFTDTFTDKVCGNPASSKSISAIFLIAFACSLSQSHILVILISTFFIIMIFVMVICDE